jgi:hypothetical protein
MAVKISTFYFCECLQSRCECNLMRAIYLHAVLRFVLIIGRSSFEMVYKLLFRVGDGWYEADMFFSSSNQEKGKRSLCIVVRVAPA